MNGSWKHDLPHVSSVTQIMVTHFKHINVSTGTFLLILSASVLLKDMDMDWGIRSFYAEHS